MSKTFLQHCKDVCREAGLANGEASIATTTAQIGQVGRIVGYVRQAWIEIQNIHQHSGLHWRWMRRTFTLVTVAGTSTYDNMAAAVNDADSGASLSRFRNWMIKDYNDPPKVYLQSSGKGTEGWLTYLDWDQFKYIYGIGTQNEAFPAHISINPQNKIVIGPAPNDVYVITGDYMLGAQVFAADNDEADIPEAFESAIMYKALTKYGIQKNAIEAVTMGEDGYATYLGALEGDQLSEIPIGNAMA